MALYGLRTNHRSRTYAKNRRESTAFKDVLIFCSLLLFLKGKYRILTAPCSVCVGACVNFWARWPIFTECAMDVIMSHATPASHDWTSYGGRCRLRLKRDGTRAETRFRLSAKRTSPFKSPGASVQSTTGSRAMHIRVCTARASPCSAVTWRLLVTHSILLFPLHFSSHASPCAIHHISNAVYLWKYGNSYRKLEDRMTCMKSVWWQPGITANTLWNLTRTWIINTLSDAAPSTIHKLTITNTAVSETLRLRPSNFM
jgi:hypothetical protein